MTRSFWIIVSMTFLAACASKMPTPSYPVFVDSNEIPDSFLAELPGTRVKILARESQTRAYSVLLQLPADWNFSTGGALDKTLEIYLLEGDLTLGEFDLKPGGYAYLPSRFMGVKMSSRAGAVMLYFIDDAEPEAVIQSPIISDSNLLAWQASDEGIDGFGFSNKELRSDPGSGARTRLTKIEPGADQDWQSFSATEEGYLVSGNYWHGECVNRVTVPGEYIRGGYYRRPPGAVNGGPGVSAVETSIWFVRERDHGTITRRLTCELEPADQ